MDLLARGGAGIFAAAGGIGISTLQHVEIWLRITSLIVGIAVGLATLFGLMLRICKDSRDHDRRRH